MNRFTPPINGECICKLTFSSRIDKFLFTVLLLVLSFSIPILIGNGINYFIPSSLGWLEKTINIVAIITGIFFFYKLSSEEGDKKFIYYTKNGLTHRVGLTRRSDTFLDGEISFISMFGTKDSKIVFDNSTYYPMPKYKNNVDLLVEFLNEKQQEWEELRIEEIQRDWEEKRRELEEKRRELDEKLKELDE